jgi:hypothetical protein
VVNKEQYCIKSKEALHAKDHSATDQQQSHIHIVNLKRRDQTSDWEQAGYEIKYQAVLQDVTPSHPLPQATVLAQVQVFGNAGTGTNGSHRGAPRFLWFIQSNSFLSFNDSKTIIENWTCILSYLNIDNINGARNEDSELCSPGASLLPSQTSDCFPPSSPYHTTMVFQSIPGARCCWVRPKLYKK